MSGDVTEESGVSNGQHQQRLQSVKGLAEWKSLEQVENGSPSTSPSSLDSDNDDDDGGEKSNRPFRCLDCRYRRELVRVYLTNVELICRNSVEERRGKLEELIQDKARWSSFCAFWMVMEQSSRCRVSGEKTEPLPPKDEKAPQNRTKWDPNAGEELNKDCIERDGRRLTELGRWTIEIFVFDHIFSKIEVAYREALALKKQEELIREEEATWVRRKSLKRNQFYQDELIYCESQILSYGEYLRGVFKIEYPEFRISELSDIRISGKI
ncbi:hypothetical protein OROGR_015688 [Orobanche gracilis]